MDKIETKTFSISKSQSARTVAKKSRGRQNFSLILKSEVLSHRFDFKIYVELRGNMRPWRFPCAEGEGAAA